MFIKRVYCHYTVHETFIMKSCLHVDLMHCIHIEFVDPPSKTVYNILINSQFYSWATFIKQPLVFKVRIFLSFLGHFHMK